MSTTRVRTIRTMLFLALFVFIELTIDWTGLRSQSITPVMDSFSLVTGLPSQLIEDVLVGAAAYMCLKLILLLSGSLQFLTGEPRREVRAPEEFFHEAGPADE